MSIAIDVKNVSKVFTLHRQREMTLRQHFTQMLKQTFQTSQPIATPQQFSALQTVSFTVQQGESVAIIGRNGAGKSTLMRIISNIMRPTTGRVHIQGSYTSLLGIGTGFINNMTGRKNIYLNAAIFGKSPTEVDVLMDDIVAFADIGTFIDVPVKDYSSGMQARLAFSIIIHLLTDIVLLDEVLSVGDTAFQEKCLQRMLNLKQEGRTFLFVSHSFAAISLLCERTIWLDNGLMMIDGDTDAVLAEYRQFMDN
ncbi:MAG: ABC transporter ATP-binding protein [Anaerolineae bacterium]|nr:ABC transporter ATP-binding protein [Anaerolineae bacterium]